MLPGRNSGTTGGSGRSELVGGTGKFELDKSY